MNHETIYRTRASSRTLVRELGFLRPGAAICGIPFPQCHALIELDEKGTLTSKELAQILKVDKSAMSRTIRDLIKKRWVLEGVDTSDPRRKPITLSSAGRLQLKKIHESANRVVKEALLPLSHEDHTKIIEGLELYAQALCRANRQKLFSIRPISPEDNSSMAKIIREVMPEFGANGSGFAINDPEVDNLFANYPKKHACFFVVEKNGKVMGGGGIGPLKGADSKTCELRKMYFLPEARGFGLGRKLLTLCLHEAKRLGYVTCYLETLERMHSARKLYERMGFQKLTRPVGNTGHFGCDMWYSKKL